MRDPFQLLRSRRSGERIGFDRLAERLEAFGRAHPEDEAAIGRLATFLSHGESEDQVLLDKALADTFPASDPPSQSDPITT